MMSKPLRSFVLYNLQKGKGCLLSFMLPDDFDIFDRSDVVKGVQEGVFGDRRTEAPHKNFPARHFDIGVETRKAY